jgi:hypothetical protein
MVTVLVYLTAQLSNAGRDFVASCDAPSAGTAADAVAPVLRQWSIATAQLFLCPSKIAIRMAQIRNSLFLQRTTDAAILC